MRYQVYFILVTVINQFFWDRSLNLDFDQDKITSKYARTKIKSLSFSFFE
jgi:hypothetical protein